MLTTIIEIIIATALIVGLIYEGKLARLEQKLFQKIKKH